MCADGSTATAGPHEYPAAYAEGLQLYYWIGIGGHPEAAFECSLTLAQAGAAVANGSIAVKGQLDASGVAAVQDWVNVL